MLAAIDQYERTLTKARPKPRPQPGGLIAIYVPPERWAGELNPDEAETNPAVIRHFGGIGLDGNGDGRADRTDDEDMLWTVAQQLLKSGTAEDDFAIGAVGILPQYPGRPAHPAILRAVRRLSAGWISTTCLPRCPSAPTIRTGTPGARRGAGAATGSTKGRIFSPITACPSAAPATASSRRRDGTGSAAGGSASGTSTTSTITSPICPGTTKSLKPGDIVKPGQVIGWVGSSGYGKPGTSGKFPPHLHSACTATAASSSGRSTLIRC